MYIEQINGPEDVKKLTDDEMIKLAAEMIDSGKAYDKLNEMKDFTNS